MQCGKEPGLVAVQAHAEVLAAAWMWVLCSLGPHCPHLSKGEDLAGCCRDKSFGYPPKLHISIIQGVLQYLFLRPTQESINSES